MLEVVKETNLVGLRDVCEDAVDHADDHAVFVRVSRVLNDRHDVRPLLCHVGQVTARAVRELHRVHHSVL